MQRDSPPPDYSSKSITVLTFDEAIRRRPAMYFGVGRDDPQLMAMVARCAAEEPFDLADDDTQVQVRLTIHNGISFTVEDDLSPLTDADGRPQSGFSELIDRRRWRLAAAIAVSVHASVEVRTGVRAWCQDFTHPGSPSLIRDLGPSAAIGTRATITLDADYFAPGSSLPAGEEP